MACIVDPERVVVMDRLPRMLAAHGRACKPEGGAMRRLLMAGLLLCAGVATAGPFGLKQGMTLADLQRQGSFTPTSQEFVQTASVLAGGHPDFASYTALVTPVEGVCQVSAVSKGIDTTADGMALNKRFRGLVDAMAVKYGPPTNVHDHLRMGSVLHGSQLWMAGLLQRDRVLIAEWAPSEPALLRDSLTSIRMTTSALSESRGQIELEYRFGNYRNCQDAIKGIVSARLRL
jgi:hypothetical protein